ncbi:copper chaperone PCu(A)C [uncultured Halomonas sp.]|uniref:copper chaperone PCu(A)C n=1 Tax=uncultured Halomonas sp. TaxID=173971 RepID=UPI00261F284F|nr:copper chaperone PCu(A)C [uncultured Halomonas sp.]
MPRSLPHVFAAGLVGLALTLAGQAALAEAPERADLLQIEEALVRAVPPVSTTTAAFMMLNNPGERDLAVVDARSPAAGITELHNHVDVDGVMQMRRVPEIAVPAGGSTELAPGGLHLMLIDLVAPLEEGEEVEITLVLESDETLTFSAPVKRIEVMGGDHHGHGGHHHH